MPDTVRMLVEDADAARANYDEIAAVANEEIADEFARGVTYTVELTTIELLCLIGAAQLGLRHPEHTGASHTFAVNATRKLAQLYPVGSARRNIAMQGFDPAYDVPRRVNGD